MILRGFSFVVSVVAILCLVSSFWIEIAMAATCSHVEGVAGSLMPTLCDCPAQTTCQCTVDEINFQSAECGSCEYCAFEENLCVVIGSAVGRSDETSAGLGLVYATLVTFTYTTGPWTGVVLGVGNYCDISVNYERCPCEEWDCNGDGTADGYAADCSAFFGLEAGAAAINMCLPNFGIASSDNPMIGLIVDINDPCQAAGGDTSGGAAPVTVATEGNNFEEGGGDGNSGAYTTLAFSSIAALAVLECSAFLD
jgi:hypothetical protein